MEPRVLVCSFGNRLKTDDGLGGRVIERLSELDLPDTVTLMDFGTSAFKAALQIGDYDRVIAIDAITACGAPGSLYRVVLHREDVAGSVPADFSISLHEVGLRGALAVAALIGSFPGEVVILGCEPASTAFGLAPSKAVEKATAGLLKLVLEEIGTSRLGRESAR